MRCLNIASARLVPMLGQLHISATAACYCIIQYKDLLFWITTARQASEWPHRASGRVLVAQPRIPVSLAGVACFTQRAMQVILCETHATQCIGPTTPRYVTDVSLHSGVAETVAVVQDASS